MQTQSSQAAQANIAVIGSGDVIQFGANLTLRGVRMHFDRNAEIFGEDEPSDYVYRVVSGAVRICAYRRRPPSNLGLPFTGRHFRDRWAAHASAEAVTAAKSSVRRSCLRMRSITWAARALLRLPGSIERCPRPRLVLGRGRWRTSRRFPAAINRWCPNANRSADVPRRHRRLSWLVTETAPFLSSSASGDRPAEFAPCRHAIPRAHAL
jgi:hypothetical protein